MRRLLIFDCDGTLVDTITDVGICFNSALRECGFPEHPLASYGGFVGGNLETIIKKLLPKHNACPDNVDKVKKAYRAIYSKSKKENTKLFPGIYDLLNDLREKGFILTVNTNKGQALTDELLESLFPQSPFACVVGYDETRPSKPDPFGVDMICHTCALSRNEAVYIGDSLSDINTAYNANIPCILVTWGQGTDCDRRDNRVHCVVDTVEELKKQLELFLLKE